MYCVAPASKPRSMVSWSSASVTIRMGVSSLSSRARSLLTGLDAADAGHVDVHKNKIGIVVGSEIESLVAILGFENTHSFRLKALSDEKALHAVIVTYKH